MRKGHDRKRQVLVRKNGNDATIADIKVLEAMHFQIRVDHTIRWSVRNSGCSCVVNARAIAVGGGVDAGGGCAP